MFGVVGMKVAFLKIKRIRAVFISETRKRKEMKMKIQNCYSTISSSSSGCPHPNTI
jgi:hypothetical protein